MKFKLISADSPSELERKVNDWLEAERPLNATVSINLAAHEVEYHYAGITYELDI